MMRSMFTGVSGLRVHQTRMDVIANNVANVNTIGFKTARATFQDAFYQNLSGATAANPAVGRTGTNPQQIGLGLSMGSIDNIMTQGAAQRTDFGMDIMIQNDGMFIVEDNSGRFFTRAGNITQDARGNLGINGMQLMGWDTEEVDGVWVVNRSNLRPLSMSGPKANMPSESTTFMELSGNLNIRDLVNRQYDADGNLLRGDIMRRMSVYDSLGHNYEIDVRFTYHQVDGAPNYWTFEFLGEELPAAQGGGFVVHAWQDGIRSTNQNPVQPGMLRMHAGELGVGGGTVASGVVAAATMRPSGTLAFDSNGQLVGMGPTGARVGTAPLDRPGPTTPFVATAPATGDVWQRTTGTLTMHLVPVRGFNPRSTFGDVDGSTIVYGDLTGDHVATTAPVTQIPVGTMTFDMSTLFNQGGMGTNAGFEPINGNPPGTLRDISIGSDGTITGMFTNGRIRTLGQIPVAMFANPAGLQRMGSNLWAATANSGSFDGIGEIGDIRSGALEMSNVDLAEEFTGMIVTQRGFQASSRLISVSDEMIQELVNLRR
ncbi:MAG: flagellar hook protein FlgE [Defluviitaleaceae bacterium]|nr:flagellar hook protein FlgE [Defluviitaleaceae bacterium]MCL2275300.1 flagellar hook protein FlgE [Defluviitaleaceae bacterium]